MYKAGQKILNTYYLWVIITGNGFLSVLWVFYIVLHFSFCFMKSFITLCECQKVFHNICMVHDFPRYFYYYFLFYFHFFNCSNYSDFHISGLHSEHISLGNWSFTVILPMHYLLIFFRLIKIKWLIQIIVYVIFSKGWYNKKDWACCICFPRCHHL